MASSWGSSWGTSWGNSWGATQTVAQPVPVSAWWFGGNIVRKKFKKKLSEDYSEPELEEKIEQVIDEVLTKPPTNDRYARLAEMQARAKLDAFIEQLAQRARKQAQDAEDEQIAVAIALLL